MRQSIVMVSARALVVVASCLALSSLALSQVTFGGKPWNPRDQVNYSIVTSATNSRLRNQGAELLVTEGDLQSFWTRATGQAPQTAPRGITWLREKVIAVSLGQRESGGYSIFVQSLEKAGGLTIVRAVERMPMPGQWVAPEPSSPFVLIRVDRAVSSVSLDVRQQDPSQIGGTGSIIITNPGAVIVNPNNYDQPGGGWSGDPRNEIEFSDFSSGTFCAIRNRGLVTLDNDAQYQAYWGRLTGQDRQAAPRGVNWWKERVVVVHLGTRPSSGYQLRVVRVERNGNAGIVRAIEQRPVPGSFVNQVETSPYVMLRVPRTISSFSLDIQAKEAGGGGIRVFGDGLR